MSSDINKTPPADAYIFPFNATLFAIVAVLTGALGVYMFSNIFPQIAPDLVYDGLSAVAWVLLFGSSGNAVGCALNSPSRRVRTQLLHFGGGIYAIGAVLAMVATPTALNLFGVVSLATMALVPLLALIRSAPRD